MSFERLYCICQYRGQALTLSFRTDFWGPASNFGIPIAAVMDIQKDPEMWDSFYSSIPIPPLVPQHLCLPLIDPLSNLILTKLSQHFRSHDRRPYRLLRNIHALLPRRHAQELPPLRLPCDQFHFSDHTGISVLELLEVCPPAQYLPTPNTIQSFSFTWDEYKRGCLLIVELAGEVVKRHLLRRVWLRERLLVLNKNR